MKWETRNILGVANLRNHALIIYGKIQLTNENENKTESLGLWFQRFSIHYCVKSFAKPFQ